MIKPIRFYLILLAAGVVGISLSLIYKQQADDYEANRAEQARLQSQLETPTPKTILNGEASDSAEVKPSEEADSLDSLMGSITDTDFSDSTLSDASLGL